ncbi:hypothetical protein [Sphingomonas sp. NFR15]|uniref:hypothetical protein n=1 Tax=Sphingomonas sp. NFR15 TaxID=1566282 RepID=UPI00159FA618|nr:hypothetical protein [Sphingomonas sp. NFR15]
MRNRQIVLNFGSRIKVSFGFAAVVVKRERVGCRDSLEHGFHGRDLAYVAQAELHHSEGALARSARWDRQNEGKDCNRAFHCPSVRGTAAMRNVRSPPVLRVHRRGLAVRNNRCRLKLPLSTFALNGGGKSCLAGRNMVPADKTEGFSLSRLES